MKLKLPPVHPRAEIEKATVRYCLWSWTFGLACWLATHGPKTGPVEIVEGVEYRERLLLPLARRAMRLSHRLWLDEFSPDW